jgi:4-amino-4-deoxy-L-arabinose transferase-like glycosyltransferase
LALALLKFDPIILAHGTLVTTEMGVTCVLFASVYAFYRYVKRPTLARLGVAGIAAGLALASKHSGLLVFPILALLARMEVAR